MMPTEANSVAGELSECQKALDAHSVRVSQFPLLPKPTHRLVVNARWMVWEINVTLYYSTYLLSSWKLPPFWARPVLHFDLRKPAWRRRTSLRWPKPSARLRQPASSRRRGWRKLLLLSQLQGILRWKVGEGFNSLTAMNLTSIFSSASATGVFKCVQTRRVSI